MEPEFDDLLQLGFTSNRCAGIIQHFLTLGLMTNVTAAQGRILTY